MNQPSPNVLQGTYLNDLRKRHASVQIYLMNGVRQHGRIMSFDQHTVLLQTSGGQVMVYKHMVASMMPAPRGAQESRPRTSPAASSVSGFSPKPSLVTAGPSAPGVPATERAAGPTPSGPTIIRKPAPRRFKPGGDGTS